MLDVLLINPPYSFTDLVTLKKKKPGRGFYLNYPHLGLGYLAAATRQAGFQVKILDAPADFLTEKDIVSIIKTAKPKVVGITVTTQTSQGVYHLVKSIKRISSPPEVVIGGPHVSALPQSVSWLKLKYGFIGEGEIGFVKFLNYLLKHQGTLKRIPGLVSVKNRRLHVNPNPPIKNLDQLPFPARDLMGSPAYFSPVISGKITSLLSSRGCPFNCIYCSRPAIGHFWRARSPEKILQEMQQVVDQFQVVYIEFADDTLTLNKDRIKQLCRLIQKAKLKVAWGGQTRADLVDAKLLKQMKQAGCLKLSFGLETGVERIRYLLGKRIPDKSYIQAFRHCRKLQIETNAFVMFGHPTETLEDMKQSINFTLNLNPDYAAFYITTILPGSSLYQTALTENKVTPTVWKNYMLGKARLPAYIPNGLKLKDLEAIHRRAFINFYLRPSYIVKRIGKIKSFPYLANTLKSGLTIFTDYIAPVKL